MHEVQTEGLPNITGRIYAHLANSDAIYNTGAFDSRSNIGLRNLRGGDSKSSGYYAFNAAAGETKIDGTLKNDVYGKSDHVTTYNSAIQIWKRIS